MSQRIDEEESHTEEVGETLAEMRGEATVAKRDQARIEQLKGSIVRIEEQIEETRKELDAVCDGLKRGAKTTPASAPPVTNNTINGDCLSPTSPASNTSNELILEKARTAVTEHIKMLTKYNQLKDVAMGLFELIAEQKGVRISEILREEGVELDD